jgi:hypothetical protein
MQIETSRGCSFSCSFCPRDHKGIWYSPELNDFAQFLKDVRNAFDGYGYVPRKLFIVDEEFFGYEEDTETRVLDVATQINQAGFSFEISARLDQVYRSCKSIDWHARRLNVWMRLVTLGLERCLFGVESGVNSILDRFQKKLTTNQINLAIRILSLASVPIRLTYITFDPLMNMEELIQTYKFQYRTDLLLSSTKNKDAYSILNLAINEENNKKNANETPLFETFPYLLVSLECLLGSDYYKESLKNGLNGPLNLFLGKMDSSYVDSRIGVLSKCAQLWIDRNFSLDYVLKSLTKIRSKKTRNEIIKMRLIIKRFSFRLLGAMLVISNNDLDLETVDGDGRNALECAVLSGWTVNSSLKNLNTAINLFMGKHLENMKLELIFEFKDIQQSLDDQVIQSIQSQLIRLTSSNSWISINSGERA